MSELSPLAGLSGAARDARAWPFEQARSLLKHVAAKRLDRAAAADAQARLAAGETVQAVADHPQIAARPVVLETGYGPSGLPHVGTFGEVARTTMVRSAFRALTEDRVPTTLICFSDDMDGLRKAPPGLPHQDWLEEDLDKPLTQVRDPFEEESSFGAYNNARLRRFLDKFGFDYDFRSSTEAYRSGVFDATLRKALERFDEIQAVMLPTLGPERRATYSPFLPISPKTGHVLQVPTLERNVEAGTIVFEDEDGTRTEVPVTGGHVKMQWKPDWAMRWVALDVDYEMSGKDLIDSVKVSNKVARILGGEPPCGFNYEMFLDGEGAKISKSKNNGLTMEEWLRYGPPESLSYYMFQSPKSAKKLSFDVIPKAADEYIQQLDAFNRGRHPTAHETIHQRKSGNVIISSPSSLDNPVWSVHGGHPPGHGSPVNFSLLLNVVSAADAGSEEMLWSFIRRYKPDASPETEPLLASFVGRAIAFYEDYVRPTKRFRAPDERERMALADLKARLEALPADADGEAVQAEVYEAGKSAGFEPLRLWFGALYETLLGQPQGPRFGSFAAIFGLDRTVALIGRVLAGEDLGVLEPEGVEEGLKDKDAVSEPSR